MNQSIIQYVLLLLLGLCQACSIHSSISSLNGASSSSNSETVPTAPPGNPTTPNTPIAPLSYDFFGSTSISHGSFVTNSTIGAGSKDGVFRSPFAAAADPANNLVFISDSANYRIVKMNSATGAFIGAIGNSLASGTCISGKQNGWCTGGSFSQSNGDGKFWGPAGIGMDLTNGFFYIADLTSIKKFNTATGAFVGAIGNSTVSGTCVAGKQNGWCTGGVFSSAAGDGVFTDAMGIAIDVTNDRFYVSDHGQHNIQKFILSTGAYVGSIGNSTASGTCLAGKQNIWCTGGVFSLGSADGMFYRPTGLAVDAVNDRLIVVDTSNNRLHLYTPSSGAFVGTIGGVFMASGTCTFPVQSAWCTGASSFLSTGDGGFIIPSDVVLDVSANRMYITDRANYRVQKFVLSTGAFVGMIGGSFTAQGTCLAGKQNTWCSGGNMYSNMGFTDGLFFSPTGLAIDSTHDLLFVLDNVTHRVKKFTLSTGAFIGVAGGNIVPANGWNKTSIAGTTSSIFINETTTSIPGVLASPESTAVDVASDRFYIADKFRIQKFVLSTGAFIGAIGKSTASGTCIAGKQNGWCTGGMFSTGNGDGEIGQLTSIAVDIANDRLYVSQGYRIQKFILSTGAFVGAIGNSTASGTCIAGKQNTWCTGGVFSAGAGDGMFSTSAIKLDTVNGFFYLADQFNYRVQKFSLSTGAFIGAIGKSTASGTCVAGKQNTWCTGGVFSTGMGDGLFSSVKDVAIDAGNDRLYVTDASSLQMFTLSSGAFLGAIGNSTVAAGTCTLGIQNNWCVGGTFTFGNGEGAFTYPKSLELDLANDVLYLSDGYQNPRIQKLKLSSGKGMGSIGRLLNASGNCRAGAQSEWCDGGATFVPGFEDGMFAYETTLTFADGKLYISDTNNNRIQRLSP